MSSQKQSFPGIFSFRHVTRLLDSCFRICIPDRNKKKRVPFSEFQMSGKSHQMVFETKKHVFFNSKPDGNLFDVFFYFFFYFNWPVIWGTFTDSRSFYMRG